MSTFRTTHGAVSDPCRTSEGHKAAYLLFLTHVICLDAHPVQLVGFRKDELECSRKGKARVIT
jgi:hypothetical protein